MLRKIINLKDKGLSRLLGALFKLKLGELAEVLECKIDSSAKSLTLSILPAGEKEPIELWVDNYEFVSENGVEFIRLKGIRASRAWIDMLISQLFNEKFPDGKIEIPDGKLLGMIKAVT